MTPSTVCAALGDSDGPPPSLDNCTVLVVGGGGTGMELVRQLAKTGSWVTVLQRGEKFRSEIEGLGAMLAVGDVLQVRTRREGGRGIAATVALVHYGAGRGINWTTKATSLLVLQSNS